MKALSNTPIRPSVISWLHNRPLLVILILGVLLRLAVAFLLGDQVEILPAIYDQVSYSKLAENVAAGKGFSFDTDWWPATRAGEPTAHWSYLFTLYLATMYKLFGYHPLIARLLQALLSGILMPWLAYRLARRALPSSSLKLWRLEISPALLAAAWVAFYPYFLYYAGALMTETFYMTAILWTLERALTLTSTSPPAPLLIGEGRKGRGGRGETGVRSKGVMAFLLLGLALGVTVLLRQAFLLFVPFLFLWLGWAFTRQPSWRASGRRLLLGGLLSLLVLAACIAPFTLLNYRQFGRFVLLNTNAGYAFFWANHPVHGSVFVSLFTEEMPSYQELIPSELRHLNEAALEQALLKRGLGFVIEDPLRFLLLCVTRIPAHFIFWPRASSSLPSNLTRVGSLGLALPFMIAGGILWFNQARRRRLDPLSGALLVLFIVVYVGVHLVSWAGIRYRLPADSVGLIFAAYALWRLLNWLLSRRCQESPAA